MPENSTNLVNLAFKLGKSSKTKLVTIPQDEQRDGDMPFGSIMALEPGTPEWMEWTDAAATDGSQFPAGILLRTVTEAEIIAGDVTEVPILIGDCVVPYEQLVFTGVLDYDTVINVPVNTNKPAWRVLHELGIFIEWTTETTEQVIPD